MGDIVVNKQMLNDALYSGYKYLENNKLSKGIKYLEFVYENSKEKDYYLNYALITAYYNMGLFEKAQNLLKITDIENIENVTIKETLKQIKIELSKEEELNKAVKATETKEYIPRKEEFLVYNKLKILLPEENNILEEIKNFDDKIKKMKSDLIIDFKSFYLYNSIKSIDLYKYLGEYSIYEMLIQMNDKEILETVENLKKEEYFFLKTKNLLKSIKLFKEFFIIYIEEKDSLKMLKILRESYKIEKDNFFVYQGIISDIFSDILEDQEISSTLRNEIFKILIHVYTTGIFSKEMVDELFLANKDIVYQNNYLLYIKVDEEIVKYVNKKSNEYQEIRNINKKYLFNKLNSYYTIDVKEVIKNILTYMYFTSRVILEGTKNKIEQYIEKDEEKIQLILEEINKKQ